MSTVLDKGVHRTYSESSLCRRYQLEETTKIYLELKKRFNRNLLEKRLIFLKPDDLVVEIGSGLGNFAVQCKSKGFKYVAFQPSLSLQQVLKEKNIDVRAAFVPPIPLKSNICDLVYGSFFLEHLPTHLHSSNLVL